MKDIRCEQSLQMHKKMIKDISFPKRDHLVHLYAQVEGETGQTNTLHFRFSPRATNWNDNKRPLWQKSALDRDKHYKHTSRPSNPCAKHSASRARRFTLLSGFPYPLDSELSTNKKNISSQCSSYKTMERFPGEYIGKLIR